MMKRYMDSNRVTAKNPIPPNLKKAGERMSKIKQGTSLLIDGLLINLSIILAFLIRFQGSLPKENFNAYLLMWIPITLIMLLTAYVFELHNWTKIEDVQSQVIKAVTSSILTIVAIVYARRNIASAFPSSVFVISWLLAILFLSSWRVMIKEIFRPMRRVVIVGSGREGQAVASEIAKRPRSGYHLVGFVGKMMKRNNHSQKWLGEYDDLLEIIEHQDINEVIITVPPTSNLLLWDTILSYQGSVRFKAIPDIYESVIGKIGTIQIEAVPLINVFVEPISGWNRSVKRAVDIGISLPGLILLAPIFLIIMVLIRIDSKGPFFFKQERVGRGMKLFNVYKFRSMYLDAERESGPVLAVSNDHRVTNIGRFLRKTRLDELPQLFNVLAGQMSLIGPRPERPFFVNQFINSIPGYHMRFKVRPGITGLAQVNASYDISAKDKTKYDLLYIRNYSLLLDLKIMIKTVLVVLQGEGAN